MNVSAQSNTSGIRSEDGLLQRLVGGGDPAAFAEASRAYAGMVYGTCLRITGNPDHAADAAQETFYHLLKNARHVSGSLTGWLHRVATRRAVDLIRRDAARRRREQAYAAEAVQETDRWADVSPLVDEAMEELDDPPREVLVRHFLKGEPMTEIASSLGVSQPTISRRVDDALEELRNRLKARGVLVTTVIALGAMLANAVQTAPSPLISELGKMALANSATSATAAAAAALSGLKAKLAIAAASAAFGAVVIFAYKYHKDAEATPAPAPTAVAAVAPDAAGTRGAIASDPKNAPAPLAQPPAPVARSPRAAVAVPQGPVAAAAPRGAARVGGAGGAGAAAPGAVGFGGFAGRTATAPRAATPQDALRRFASALSRGDLTRIEACLLPGAPEAEELRRVLTTPQTDEERSVKQCLEALGTPVELVATNAVNSGLIVTWRATVKKPFTLVEQGAAKTWQPGDRYEMITQLKRMGTDWKIVGL